MILLTGAAGRVRFATGRALAPSSVPFRALVRDPDKVAFDPDAAELLGRPAMDLEAFTQQFAGAFQPTGWS